MTEPDPERPRTVNVDAEISRATHRMLARLTSTTGITFLGALTAGLGLLLRVFAHTLAWPKEVVERGPETIFAGGYGERLYIDIGMVLMVFGLALVFLGIVRANRTPEAA